MRRENRVGVDREHRQALLDDRRRQRQHLLQIVEAGDIARVPAVVERGAQRLRIGGLQVRSEADIAAPALVLAQFDHRHHQHQHYFADAVGAAARLDLIQHLASAPVQHGSAIDNHLADQFLFGAKMIVQSGIIALPGRIDDFLHRNAVHSSLRKQQLRRRLDLVLGLFRRGARRRAHSG